MGGGAGVRWKDEAKKKNVMEMNNSLVIAVGRGGGRGYKGDNW